MKETELSEPIGKWLEKQGYSVSFEVKNCDIVARKGEELIIVELKIRFTLDLVYQALNRKKMTESVYVAVPVPQGKKSIPKIRAVRQLLHRLEVGLILVRFLKTKTRVEIALHPAEYIPRKAVKRRKAIIREIDGRYSEFNTGGSSVTDRRVSAYRQQALVCAWLLDEVGDLSPSSIIKYGGGSKSQQILSANIYGWFNRVKRGIYTLDPAGKEALEKYRDILREITAKINLKQNL